MKYETSRLNDKPVDCDVEKRILRNVAPLTDSLATDGAVILPRGVDSTDFEKNPVVLYKHSLDLSAPSTIGRAIALEKGEREILSEVQFADNELGRGLAYLYGVNEQKEVYMRAWSVAGAMVKRKTWSWEEARAFFGGRWDANMETMLRARGYDQVLVCTEFSMNEFSAVELGADKEALTRVARNGLEVAGQILTRLNLQDAGECLAQLKKQVEASERNFARLEQEIQALRSEGASAAAQRNSEAVLAELTAMLEVAKNNR